MRSRPWTTLAQGTDGYPDQSATCAPRTAGLHAEGGPRSWVLRGPGIASTASLAVDGLPGDFPSQRQANHARFPRGVDVLLTSANLLVGLPRTTRLSTASGA